MARRPPPHPTNPAATAHSLAILSEYTHTLDSLPLDLSRHFGEFRELDAVLSSSIATLTSKITDLTSMIEDNTVPKQDRLRLLAQIADEAQRLKLGGEDKIRVACLAADGLHGHKTHMRNLLDHMPDPDFENMAGRLARKTVYPHVTTRIFLPPHMTADGNKRQRRGGFGSLLSNPAVEGSPSKRKRAARDDDGELPAKASRRERANDASHRQRNGARAKKTERAGSPTESLLSVASHLPHTVQQTQSHNANARPSGSGRTNTSTSRRSRAAASSADAQVALAEASGKKDLFNAPPSSSSAHPSLPLPFASNGIHGMDLGLPGVSEWAHGQLEGPGMPVARSFVSVSAAAVTPVPSSVDAAALGEADGEGDDGRTYCICDQGSYGEMIACDDKACDREWFHLTCIGLEVPPEGTWFCDSCISKRLARRNNRGGKRRAGGGRTAARNTST